METYQTKISHSSKCLCKDTEQKIERCLTSDLPAAKRGWPCGCRKVAGASWQPPSGSQSPNKDRTGMWVGSADLKAQAKACRPKLSFSNTKEHTELCIRRTHPKKHIYLLDQKPHYPFHSRKGKNLIEKEKKESSGFGGKKTKHVFTYIQKHTYIYICSYTYIGKK